MLDLESEAMRGLGSISTGGGGNICHWIFLVSHSKDKNANIVMSVRMQKTRWRQPLALVPPSLNFKDHSILGMFKLFMSNQ